MLISIGLVVGGLVLLVVASDRLVVSAVKIARSLRVSKILVGAVIVGLGTSLPELLVSSLAARDGELDVAMANVVGSNVANVALVLGCAALFSPIVLRHAILRREGWLMFVSVAALSMALVDGRVSRVEGALLLVGLALALILLASWSKYDNRSVADNAPPVGLSFAWELIFAATLLVATVAGANILLDGAFNIGKQLGLSQTFLGLLLGVGTSLPELATVLAAARRRESDLVLGNVLGSNIFNSLAVAGAAGLVGPALLVDLGLWPITLMLIAVLIAGVFARTGEEISRREGVALLGMFAAYLLVAL